MKASLTSSLNHLQHGGYGDTIVECLKVRHLDSWAVGNRVREGETEFNDIYHIVSTTPVNVVASTG